MYCQQCGAEVGSGKFCRKCGAPAATETLSVQQAQPAAAAAAPTDYEKGFKKLFMGLAFLIIAIFPIFTSGRFWWWMLFPAVPLMATGIAEFMRGRSVTTALPAAPVATLSAQPPATQVSHASQGELPRARNTSELVPPPPSVTEGTTRHLNKEPLQRD